MTTALVQYFIYVSQEYDKLEARDTIKTELIISH